MRNTPSAATTAPAAPVPGAPDLPSLIADLLDDAKAEDTTTIDMHGRSILADAMIITSGRSNRHVGAIAERVIQGLKDAGFGRVKVEGMPACDWVLIDAGDVILHIFRPEVRAFYNLEKMWSPDRPDERLVV